jgi:hypothetical protein
MEANNIVQNWPLIILSQRLILESVILDVRTKWLTENVRADVGYICWLKFPPLLKNRGWLWILIPAMRVRKTFL